MPAKTECNECGHKQWKKDMYAIDVYDTPWDKSPHTIYVCKETPAKIRHDLNRRWMESCEELLTDSSWADFRYFTCEDCQRMICEQNPRNGWHVQYRLVNECEMVCLSCYERMMFDDGLTDDDLDSGSLHGMFFDDGELSEHGFTKQADYFVQGSKQAQTIIAKAKELKAAGNKVVINYESLAIGGLEGYVSLWYAPINQE